ncbi:GNAT family N-acetyltransferase [Chitinimonas koreensis]|uniref:GNAT family N-acetyltransferase n=1 Tax=Chitinimonas koreensis TaxID=356302 RepID=UPI00048A9DBC|nr:GNAT family N-acetyltransferase [Chitinimonas koreensis]QNM97606.1 GNAT family N-acetyltransferase [Chitinimonas koreensis]
MLTHPIATIEPLAAAEFAHFLDYLDDHLQDNGADGVGYFQPQPRGATRFPPERAAAFQAGLDIPVGEPGWRRAWVARNAERWIVGHVDLRGHPERFTEHRCLLGMGVARNYRKAGLGFALLACAEQWALVTAGLEWIDLQVMSENLPAIRLYGRAGFMKIGEIPEMFRIDGREYSYTFMSKRLA